MKFVNFNVYFFVFLYFISTPVILRCDERTVVLPNNKILVLKTFLGNPIHYSNDHLRVTDFRPVFGMLQDWRVGRLSWTLHFVFADRKVRGIMNISSPQYPSLKTTIPLWADVQPRDAAEGMIIEFFHKRTSPDAWSFLTENGDSWIPFEFDVHMVEPNASFTFIEWAKVPQTYKNILINKDNAEKDFFDNAPKKQIKLDNETTIYIPFTNGNPIRYADSNFQVENFSPAYDNKAKKVSDRWIWVLTGRTRDLGRCKLEIFDPTDKNKLLASMEFNGNGVWQIPFAEKTLAPNFWSWENQSKDQWVAVKIRLTMMEKNETREWYEALMIDKNIRRNFEQYRQ